MVGTVRWSRVSCALALAAALAVTTTTNAPAQDLANRLGFGGAYGGMKAFGSDSLDVKDSSVGPHFGGSVAYGLSRALLLTVGVRRGIAKEDVSDVPDSTRLKAIVMAYELGLDWRLLGASRFTPYIEGGAGITSWRHLRGDTRLDGGTDFSWRAGGGFQIGLTKHLLLDLGARYHGIGKGDEDLYAIGDHAKHYAEATAALFLFTNPLHCRDADEDGICDVSDQCPDTPRGCIVDDRGCPKDADGDGVCDGLDQCPDTPIGCLVDAQGCPKDSDADGVCDGTDQCPDTQRGCAVDEKGCPKDSDNDGVCDGVDQCPDTPRGTAVDERGCPKGAETEAPSSNYLETIHFDFGQPAEGSVDVMQKERTVRDAPTNQQALKRNLAALKAHRSWRVVIEGHSDWVGTDEHNDALSGRRAWAARTWLAQHGVTAARIDTVHVGERLPVGDNTTDEGRARNRRAEFRIVKP